VYVFLKIKKLHLYYLDLHWFEIALHNFFTLRHPKLYIYIYANVNVNDIHILEMYTYLIYTYPTCISKTIHNAGVIKTNIGWVFEMQQTPIDYLGCS
jgi:hypothetical protein